MLQRRPFTPKPKPDRAPMKRKHRQIILRCVYWPFKAVGFAIAMVMAPMVSGYFRGLRRWRQFSDWAAAEDKEE